jgi:hypothetical protein
LKLAFDKTYDRDWLDMFLSNKAERKGGGFPRDAENGQRINRPYLGSEQTIENPAAFSAKGGMG